MSKPELDFFASMTVCDLGEQVGTGLFVGMPMAAYVADPCPGPSLSSSILKVLLDRSPLHAWHRHPRLGGASDWSRRADVGSAVHALALEGPGSVVWLDYADYRTKAARQERDEVIEAGKIPMLDGDRRPAIEAAARVQQTIEQNWPGGEAEVTGIWREKVLPSAADVYGILSKPDVEPLPPDPWCRLRADYLTFGTIINVRTAKNAEPSEWQRRVCFPDQLDLAAVWYMRGMKALTGTRPEYLVLVQEIEPPYGQSIHCPYDGEAMEILGRVIDHCVAEWAGCLRTKRFPGYPAEVQYTEWPAWRSLKIMEKLNQGVST